MRFFIGLFLILWLSLSQSVGATTTTVEIGSTVVSINVTGRAGGLTYFAPHDNENTAVSATKAIIAVHGGWLIELQYGGTRNIRFVLNNVRYEFDPNRMFTDQGIKNSLQSQGEGSYSPEAHALVAHFAQKVLLTIRTYRKNSRPLVAVHNNTNGSYSIKSYALGNLIPEADETNINHAHDADDFFFVTEVSQFRKLQKLDYNVAHQSHSVMNDGSLSVYAAKSGIPYVNVEAEIGHQAIQQNMLQNLLKK